MPSTSFWRLSTTLHCTTLFYPCYAHCTALCLHLHTCMGATFPLNIMPVLPLHCSYTPPLQMDYSLMYLPYALLLLPALPVYLLCTAYSTAPSSLHTHFSRKDDSCCTLLQCVLNILLRTAHAAVDRIATLRCSVVGPFVLPVYWNRQTNFTFSGTLFSLQTFHFRWCLNPQFTRSHARFVFRKKGTLTIVWCSW